VAAGLRESEREKKSARLDVQVWHFFILEAGEGCDNFGMVTDVDG
jgi:hypothetical protein